MDGRGVRVRAPALRGRRWLGVPAGPDGPPTVAGLRGRVVLLHFFTAGCVNCVHAHAEVEHLAATHPALVVLGVHSPKFPHEASPEGLDAAVGRAGTAHPVLDDAERATWDAYAVGAWPTLVVVDPGGRIAETFVGEGHLAAVDAVVGALLLEAGPGPAPVPAPDPPGTEPGTEPGPGTALRYPSAALALPDGRLVVSDAGHRRVVVMDPPTVGEVRAGALPAGGPAGRGGPAATVRELGADWVSPGGAALLPAEVAERVGWDLAVADPGAHRVRGVRLADGATLTVAGSGTPLRPDAPAAARGGPALAAALSTPTDVAWCAGRLVVAMSGVHQLWTLQVAADPADGVLRVVAGSGVEGLLDGSGPAAMLAQPSALAPAGGARAPDAPLGAAGTDGSGVPGGGVWFVDAESSSLRRARPGGPARPAGLDRPRRPGGEDDAHDAPDPDGPWEVSTLVGSGVHAFGHADGPAARALMQHPLGVALAQDGAVLVADTYDGAVRRVDPARAEVTTLVDDLAEPVAVVPVPGGVVVVESAAHRLTTLSVAAPHHLAPGVVDVVVDLAAPAGRQIDRSGPAARLEVAALPPGLVGAGAGGRGDLVARPARGDARADDDDRADDRDRAARPGDDGVVLRARAVLGAGSGTFRVRAMAATCGAGPVPGAGAACRLHERTWYVPVVVEDGAAPRLGLAWPLDR